MNNTIEQFITKHNLKFECKRVDSRPDGFLESREERDGSLANMGQDKMRHFRCKLESTCIACGGSGREFETVEDDTPCSACGGDCRNRARSFSVYFSQGSAHTVDPTLADVLDCLASDASGYEASYRSDNSHRSHFEEWANEYGYDTDSRKAEKTFKVIKRQSEQMRRTLGAEAYEELLYNTERL